MPRHAHVGVRASPGRGRGRPNAQTHPRERWGALWASPWASMEGIPTPKNTHVGVRAPPGRPRGCLASPRPRPRTPTWAPTWAFWVSLGHGRGRGRLGDVLVFSHIIFGKLT